MPGIWLTSFKHFILRFLKCHEREEAFSQGQVQKGCRHQHDFPAAGEIVLFDRSWYNRAGVEKVMGFAPPSR